MPSIKWQGFDRLASTWTYLLGALGLARRYRIVPSRSTYIGLLLLGRTFLPNVYLFLWHLHWLVAAGTYFPAESVPFSATLALGPMDVSTDGVYLKRDAVFTEKVDNDTYPNKKPGRLRYGLN